MKSNLVSKRETGTILKEIAAQWRMELPKIKNLNVHHIQDDALLIMGEDLVAIKLGNLYLPFLSETKILEKFPSVMVDMGAVKSMCNGADVMRPGIKRFTEFENDQIVCVIEESQHKFLAVGRSYVASSEIESMTKGPVIKNIHYISDKFWEIGKTIHH